MAVEKRFDVGDNDDERVTPLGWRKTFGVIFKNFGEIVGWLSTSRMFPSTYTQYQDTSRPKGFMSNIKDRFFRAYGFDGLEMSVVTKANGKPLLLLRVTGADGKTLPLLEIPFGLVFLSFLGLPSRPATAENPKATVLQFFRNFIGGWNQVKETIAGRALDENGNVTGYGATTSLTQKRWTEKKIFLATVFIFKVAFIATFKLITFPFKFMLNVVKLATEVVLPLVSHFTAWANSYLFGATVDVFYEGLLGRKELSPGQVTYSFYWVNFGVGLVLFCVIAPLTLAVGIAQFAMLQASRMGFALTSPQKSAAMAYNAGKTFPVGPEWFKTAMGVIGYVLSLALSAVLWTITLPLALAALTTAIPGILTAINWVAQLPFVSSSLAWLSQLPVVTAGSALLSNFFATVGTALAVAFGPVVTLLAGAIGVQVPLAVMAVGTTLGLIVTPVAALLSQAADKLSNLWTQWVEQRPVYTAIKVLTPSSKVAAKGPKAGGDELDEHADDTPLLPTQPSAAGERESAPPAKETNIPVPKGGVYTYQLSTGRYILSGRALKLAERKKAAIADAEDVLERLPGILLIADREQTQELWYRAANNVDRSSTQGARLATDLEIREAVEVPTVVAF